MNYHPSFFDEKAGHRPDCKRRLDIIREHVGAGENLLDIGCSEGYYSFGLADKCDPIYALDNVAENITLCRKLKKEHGIDNITFHISDVTEFLTTYRQQWDNVLYMSVHHHVVGRYGYKVALEIFKRVASRSKQMIFDTGQKSEKNCEKYTWWQKLPEICGDEREWLEKMLVAVGFDSIKLIGTSPVHGINRFLWKLGRN